MDFKKQLKNLRKKSGLTQGQVAEALNYGYTAIISYESGRTEPSIKDLIRLAKFFDVSVDYFIGASEVPRSFTENIKTDHQTEWFSKIYLCLNANQQKLLKDMICKIVTFSQYQ